MKRYIVFLGATVLIFSVVLLSGCNEQKKVENKAALVSNFIGDWHMDLSNSTYTFINQYSGKNVKISEGQTNTTYFSWQLNNSQLCISFQGKPALGRCGTYLFTNDYKTFTWSISRGKLPAVTATFNKII